ncbi:hypothetical protein CCR75_007158 [Bremia lactucae]|uniref:RRM domain-containing protein n=1 Tax=Bremia lactucae TaxID=4779 RepID=A0A976FEU6_BRELC|nr:hypothetical protein CCR75_007158 [Bremia lactucae]
MSDRDSPLPRRSRSPSVRAEDNEEKKSVSESFDKDEPRRSRSRSPTARAPAVSVEVNNPGNNLYVANLSARTGQQELEELFSKFGRVEKCEVIVDPVTRESRSEGYGFTFRGFGFVTYEDVRDAEDAVKELNNQDIQGRKIRVEHAKRKRGHEKTPGQCK